MLVLDAIYLKLVGGPHFLPMVDKVQKEKTRLKLVPTIICYILMMYGLDYFVINRSNKPIDGFFLGIMVYGVYETVSLALLNKWDYKLAIIDTLWGGILFYLVVYLNKKLGGKYDKLIRFY